MVSRTSAWFGRRSHHCWTVPRRCARRTCPTQSARRSSSPANPSSTRSPRAIGADPVAFRLRYLREPRDIAVVKAAAEAAGWQPRPSPHPDRTGDTLVGRGIAYAQRSGAVVAIVAEVEIDRRTGKIWAKKFTVAHDCG